MEWPRPAAVARMNAVVDWAGVDLAEGRLHVWGVQATSVVAEKTADLDATTPDDVAAALLPLISDWPGKGRLSVLVAGLPSPHRASVPVKLLDLAPVPVPSGNPRIRLFALPGLKQATPVDLMDGGETRIAGFLSLNEGWDGVICLPGLQTHWAQISAGEVVSFQSFMTGDLVRALLRETGLRGAVDTSVWNPEAFGEALDAALSRPERLAAGLACLRAGLLLGTLEPDQAGARLAGLLIGAELAAARPYWLGQQLAIIGSQDATRPYAAALAQQGVAATHTDGARMALAGLTQAWRRLQLQS